MNENERKEEKGDRDSGKKLVESRYDAIDAMENAFKYTNPRRIAWRREVLKRYKDGGLFIHFHSVVGRGTDRWSECCEVHFQSGHSVSDPCQLVPAIDGNLPGICMSPAHSKSVLCLSVFTSWSRAPKGSCPAWYG